MEGVFNAKSRSFTTINSIALNEAINGTIKSCTLSLNEKCPLLFTNARQLSDRLEESNSCINAINRPSPLNPLIWNANTLMMFTISDHFKTIEPNFDLRIIYLLLINRMIRCDSNYHDGSAIKFLKSFISQIQRSSKLGLNLNLNLNFLVVSSELTGDYKSSLEKIKSCPNCFGGSDFTLEAVKAYYHQKINGGVYEYPSEDEFPDITTYNSDVLVFHGALDPIIPQNEPKEFYEQCSMTLNHKK